MARFKVALGRDGCTVSMRVLDMQEGMRGTGWMNLASTESADVPALEEFLGRIDRVTERLVLVVGAFVGSE